MIVRRVTFAVIALSALAAAAFIFVFAAAFALYALLRDILTPAGAAGAVCLAAAVLAAVAGLVAAQQARGPRLRPSPVSAAPRRPETLASRLIEVVRERPFVAAGAAAAAGLLAVANRPW